MTVACGLALAGTLHSVSAQPLPASDFFNDYEFTNVQLSPDGRSLSALTKLGQPGYNLVVLDRASGDVHQVTSLEASEVRWYRWIGNDRLIFFYAEPNPRVAGFYVAGLDGKRARRQKDSWFWLSVANNNHSLGYVGPLGSAEAQVARCHGRNDAKPVRGKQPRYSHDGQAARLLLDHDCRLRGIVEFVEAEEGRRYRLHYRTSLDERWRVIGEYLELDGHVLPLAFDYDNRHLFALSDMDRDTAALYRFDPETGELGEPVYANERYDVHDVILSDAEQRLVGVRYVADGPRTVWVEEKRARLDAAIAEALPEYAVHIEFSEDGRVALVDASGVRAPGGYWLYDAEAGTLKELLKKAEWLRPEDMAPVRAVQFEARDGLTIHGYLTSPVSFEGDAPPLIVNPHGGPYGVRTAATFNSTNQFFASRGYAVLQVDFRGSGGYGSAYEKAGRGQYGEAMVDDLADGVRWAAEEGLADPARVCIYGASYGGYSALVAAVEYPELYRCAISFAGLTDLRDHFRSAARDSSFYANWLRRQVGDFWDDKERLRRISPVHRAADFRAPVMLIHGQLDRSVHWHQTHAMQQALIAADKSVTVVLFDNEGHGLYWEENRIKAHELMLAFIEDSLNPLQVEPASE
jgi:dipeptidyl aminopeptidase/acylaminoacyl peptidase